MNDLYGFNKILQNIQCVLKILRCVAMLFSPDESSVKQCMGTELKKQAQDALLKKNDIEFPNSVSFTLNILSIQDTSQVFQNIMEEIK